MENNKAKKRKKRKTRKKGGSWFIILIIVLLVLGGLGVMLYPTICDLYYKYQAQQEVDAYEKSIMAEQMDYSALWEAADEYNCTLLTKPNQLTAGDEETRLVHGLLNPLGNGMMGYVSIPSINVRLPIYQGINEENLQSGAGFWIGSSLPTGSEGTHSIITAHTGLVKAKFFTDIEKLVIGDSFSIRILDREFFYEVDQIKVVEPNELDDLLVTESDVFTTLYTCTPYGINTHRLLVRGRLVDMKQDMLTEQPGGRGGASDELIVGIENKYLILIAVSALALIIIIIIIIVKKHRKRELKRAVTPKASSYPINNIE